MSSQDRSSKNKSGQVKKRQVKVVKSVQVKMVKFYLGLECGPTQSYLFYLVLITSLKLRDDLAELVRIST